MSNTTQTQRGLKGLCITHLGISGNPSHYFNAQEQILGQNIHLSLKTHKPWVLQTKNHSELTPKSSKYDLKMTKTFFFFKFIFWWCPSIFRKTSPLLRSSDFLISCFGFLTVPSEFSGLNFCLYSVDPSAMLLLCLMLSVKIMKGVQDNGENSSMGEIFSEKSSRFREPPPSSYLPEFCCWKRWIWITNTAKRISSVAIVGLWPLGGCSHPPCSPADSGLFALAMFSHRLLPLYLHSILLLLPNAFLIMAIFCKGWSCPSHLQKQQKAKFFKMLWSSG